MKEAKGRGQAGTLEVTAASSSQVHFLFPKRSNRVMKEVKKRLELWRLLQPLPKQYSQIISLE
jgi:hypothetical protein